MEINYTIQYLEHVVRIDIPELTPSARALIKRAIEKHLMIDLIGYGKPLQYSLKGHRRLHVSDYRIIYRIEPTTKTVIIVAIKHKNMYMKTLKI